METTSISGTSFGAKTSGSKQARRNIQCTPRVVIPYCHLSKRGRKSPVPSTQADLVKASDKTLQPSESQQLAPTDTRDKVPVRHESPLDLANLPSSPPPPICSSDLMECTPCEASPSTSLCKGSSDTSSHLDQPSSSLGEGNNLHRRAQSLPQPVPTSESTPTLTSDFIDTTSQNIYTKPESMLERSGDIRSFFSATTVSCTHDRKLPTSAPDSSFAKSSRLLAPRNSGKTRKERPMSQLLLDLSNRPTTQICRECGMSFVIGVPEDIELHKKHHKRVVDGLEWSLDDDDSQSGSRIVWRSPDGIQEEKIIKVTLDPLVLRKLKYKNKVAQILEMVNLSLDAQELTTEQLRASFLYLYVGSPAPANHPGSKKRKLNTSTPKIKKEKLVVKAMCVAARIEHAYQIVRGPDERERVDDLCLEELMRFGDTTSELYCSRKAEKSLIGIHRIWTSPNYRRAGLAQHLLNSVAMTFVYGMPIIPVEDRLRMVAFSQPTESGMRLASKWLQTIFFKIFVD